MSRKSPEEVQRQIGEAEAKLPEARKVLMPLPGVISVDIGVKEIGGLAADEIVFQILVDKKKALQDLPPEQRIPPRISGIATDVIQHDIAQPEHVLIGGSNINGSGGSGTLGAICLATAANTHVAASTPLILTNKHVAKNIDTLVGEETTCDCHCCTCCDFGRVIDSQFSSSVDAAIATLNNGVRFSHEIMLIGAVRGTAAAALTNVVVKHGRTTGFTRGVVTSITFPVNRADGQNFANQIRVAPIPPFTDMSNGGDSGSVYVNANTSQVIGLHHAGDSPGPAAYGNQIAPVLSLMKIDFPVMDTNGPSFVSHYLKTVRDADHRVPREIGGMRVENVIISMAAALRCNGSQELSTDITNHYIDVLQFVGDEDSAYKLCERARTVAAAERTRSQPGEQQCHNNPARSNN